MSTRRGTQHRSRRQERRRPPLFEILPDEPCGNCGRLLVDVAPDEGPTMSVDIGGRILFACPSCVPCLQQLVLSMAADGAVGGRPR